VLLHTWWQRGLLSIKTLVAVLLLKCCSIFAQINDVDYVGAAMTSFSKRDPSGSR